MPSQQAAPIQHGRFHGTVGRSIPDQSPTAELYNGIKSQRTSVTSGVPQGTVLGPLLFLLHADDMPFVIDTGTTMCIFADDAVIYRVIRTIQD